MGVVSRPALRTRMARLVIGPVMSALAWLVELALIRSVGAPRTTRGGRTR